MIYFDIDISDPNINTPSLSLVSVVLIARGLSVGEYREQSALAELVNIRLDSSNYSN